MNDAITAERWVSIRELSRGTGYLINEVERDGKLFVISRHGRMVALLTPLPERLIIDFEEGVTRVTSNEAQEVDVDALELSDLAREFLIDAASTPTGYWHAPDSAFLADQKSYYRTLNQLDMDGLTDSSSGGARRLTNLGRAVAKALVRRGFKGYGEVHNESR